MVAVPLFPSDNHNGTISTPKTSKDSTFPSSSSPSSPMPSPSSILYHSRYNSRSSPKSLTTTTRNLSVSFQGESFSFQSSKDKPSPPDPIRSNSHNASLSENSRLSATWQRRPDLLSRSLDCSFATARLLVLDDGDGDASSDGDSPCARSRARLPQSSGRRPIAGSTACLSLALRYPQRNHPFCSTTSPVSLHSTTPRSSSTPSSPTSHHRRRGRTTWW